MKRINHKIKRYLVLSCVLISLIIEMFAFESEIVSAKRSDNTMTKIEFISCVVNEIQGKTGAFDSKFKGNRIMIDRMTLGDIKVNDIMVKATKIKKYMQIYSIELSKAQNYAVAVVLGLVKDGSLKKLNSKINKMEAAIIIAKANELLYGKNYCPEGARKIDDETLNYVMKERIKDIGKIKGKENKKWFAKAYIYGFVEGKSEGEYSHSRKFYPKTIMTKERLLTMVGRLTGKNERVELSYDWQVCRKDNLPRNAEAYAYIIDSFPNSYYETGFNGMGEVGSEFFKSYATGTLEERMKRDNFGFVYPRELLEFNSLEYPGKYFVHEGMQFEGRHRNNEIPEQLVLTSVSFYEKALNVDYRTIDKDKEWYEFMCRFMTAEAVESYIEKCKNNKTIIECDKVAADFSGCYWNDNRYNCKVYVHMRVVSDEQLKTKNVGAGVDEECGSLFPIAVGRSLGDRLTRITLGPQYINYKLGEWIDYYINTDAQSDMFGCLNTSCTEWDIMTDYTGDYPWLLSFPYRK